MTERSDHASASKELLPFNDEGITAGSVFGSVVRAGLNSAPFTGGIASLWSEWDTSRRFHRVERAVNDLVQELASLQGRFDPNSLGDAEMQLLEFALERISREHREEKRKSFVRLLAATWIHSADSFDERRRFIDALDSFDDVHLGVLRHLRFRQESGLEPIPVTELLTEVFPHGTDDDFKFSVFMPAMNRLAAEYGFVRRRAEKTGGRIMLGINPDGLSFHALCVLSPLGIRFVQFLDGEARERE